MASALYTLFFFFFSVISSVSAEEYIVGGILVGWRLPIMNATQLYNVWASRRQFYVGDSLRFHYDAVDSVVVIGKYGFYHCDPSKPIAYFHDGNTLVNLDKPGTMYFITGDAGRCKQGIHMVIEVMSAIPPVNSTHPPPVNSTPPPSVNSTPPPPSTYKPPVKPYNSRAPSPADSVMSFAVTKSVTALFIGLGLVWALKA